MSDEKRHGIDAENRDLDRYDQVEKRQRYRLAEAEAAGEFDEQYVIRTCDMSRSLRGDAGARASFAQELGVALEEIGFAILVGHGIDPALHARAEREVRALFTEHSLEDKLRFRGEPKYEPVSAVAFHTRTTEKYYGDGYAASE